MNTDKDAKFNGSGDADGDAESVGDVLETRYRRVLMLLPVAYRAQRGEEMLGTLLDGAGEGKRWPSPGEAASLAALAMRLRAGAPGGTRRAVATGEVLRRAALAGLLALGLWHGAGGVSDLTAAIASGRNHYYFPPGSGLALIQWLLLDFGQPLLYFAAFLALVLGRRRLGRFLGVAQAGLVVALSITDRWTTLSDRAALLGVALVIAVGAGVGFHREAPRLAAPGRWLTVMAGLAGLVFIVAGADVAANMNEYSSVRVIDPIARVAGGPLLPALAAVFGLVRARRSPVWPAALLVVGLPALLLLPRTIVIYVQGKSGHLFFGDLFVGTMWPGMAIDMLIADLVLAVALGWALYRGRARSAELAA